MTTEKQIHVGLDGIVAAATRLSSVDGAAGELVIAGFPLERFAGLATFEETLYLLWHDRLPSQAELAELRADLAGRRALDPLTLGVVEAAARRGSDPMDVLRMAISTLDAGADDQGTARTVVAQMPSIAAAHWRLSQGRPVIAPRADLGHAANYLWMLSGEEPSAAQVRGLETYLNTVVDHGLNASTFTARVIISTQSDLVSAIVGAIGALKGPLHGGAPGPALDMVFEIGTKERAGEYVERAKRGEFRLMGFGHRVYKNYDPRAKILKEMANQVLEVTGRSPLLDLAMELEKIALEDEYFVSRKLYPNVDFYSGIIYQAMGFPVEMFTALFAIPRVAGWLAQWEEMLNDKEQKIARPRQIYVGPAEREYVSQL